jgi:hypothetical protein
VVLVAVRAGLLLLLLMFLLDADVVDIDAAEHPKLTIIITVGTDEAARKTHKDNDNFLCSRYTES